MVGRTVRCRDGNIYHDSQLWDGSSRTIHRFKTTVCSSRTISQYGLYGELLDDVTGLFLEAPEAS